MSRRTSGSRHNIRGTLSKGVNRHNALRKNGEPVSRYAGEPVREGSVLTPRTGSRRDAAELADRGISSLNQFGKIRVRGIRGIRCNKKSVWRSAGGRKLVAAQA